MNKPKINIIDISVILLVLILIFVATVKFRNYNETNEEGSKIDTIKYEIKISNVRNYTIDAFVIGDIVSLILDTVELTAFPIFLPDVSLAISIGDELPLK